MYVFPNFKTKKAFKTAVQAYCDWKNLKSGCKTLEPVTIFSPGPFPCKRDGKEFVEGPHYPSAHTWYAQVVVKDGIVIKVK